VAAASAGWWTFPEPDRQTTRAVAAAEAGAPDAPQRLAVALRDETRAMWRAVLIAAGAPDPGASASPDPWLRLAAASAPGARPEGLLADPVAAVRHAAARALEPVRGPDDPAMRFHRDLLEQMGDLPPYAAELATWWGSHGAADRAVPLLERAARLDPANPEHLRNLAVVRSANGDPGGAYALLQRATALAPADADLAYLLGLAAHGAGRPDAAADAFTRARTLDPRHPRAAYNLGLLLAERRDPAALTTLREAAELAPADPDPWWAIATVLAQRGDRDGARAAAERTLRLDPNHAEARQMIGR
jgi:tetratricopeptide (TPR) repeat protein